MTIYKIEDFVVNNMFLPYAPDFIGEEFGSSLFKKVQYSLESELKKRPEFIIEMLEEMPETKKKVFNRLYGFGGVKFYKYLNMENEIIKYVNANLVEMG